MRISRRPVQRHQGVAIFSFVTIAQHNSQRGPDKSKAGAKKEKRKHGKGTTLDKRLMARKKAQQEHTKVAFLKHSCF